MTGKLYYIDIYLARSYKKMIPVLTAEELIDPETEIHYAFHRSLKNITSPHSHDFYELFIVTKGSLIHRINGKKEVLNEGSLVFIRPEDEHYYEKDGEKQCELINLAFPQKAIDELFSYLGEGFDSGKLIRAIDPPFVLLSHTEKSIVSEKLENLNILPRKNKSEIKTRLRILLLELFTKYFQTNDSARAVQMPGWLDYLMEEMKKKENFSSGLPALQKLSNKSQEHLCRVFKKYLKLTPTEYINELRLNYAANLLTNSDVQIIEISGESGFENLSHFYHLFKKKFNMSPREFRMVHHRNMIPT
jgi:AraC family cel operon transcriptional repressor